MRNKFTRRQTMVGAGAAAFLGTGLGGAAQGKAPMSGVLRPRAYRAMLGGFEITTILDGAVQPPDPHTIFGEDQDPETVGALLRENYLPTDKMEISFAPVVVNTGSELVLFDTGNAVSQRPARGYLAERLGAAGYSPDQIDVVVLTHFHPDHIGGLMIDGAPAYPNARYVAPEKEFDFWSKADAPEGPRKLTEANVLPVAEKMTMIKDGQDAVSGITAIDANGHTPGHTVYHLESEGRRLLIAGDTANHYVVSLQRPDWHVRFDMDKAGAAASRKKVFGMIAADKIPFAGYHMPFPAIGYVETMGEGFRYIPASYQLNL